MELRLRRPLPLSTQWIGVDGGATEVKVHEVELVDEGGGPRLRLGERAASRVYPRVPGFETPAERGMHAASELAEVSAAETEQGWAWIESTADCIVQVTREREAKSVLVGIAMPGVKSRDGRGIEFALNGPRIPDLLERLEHLLASAGVELAAPIDRLHSDGWCCGLGEEHAIDGSFHGVDNAYYVGGGTGLAEALKFDGRLVAPEKLDRFFTPAWKLVGTSGEPLEECLSVAGINRRYARLAGFPLPLQATCFPERRVAEDERARALFELAGAELGSLIAQRFASMAQVASERSDRAPQAVRLDRVVIGQRLGALIEHSLARACLWSAMWIELEKRLRELPTTHLLYCEGRRAVRGRVRTSTLRAAPAIGAAAAALIAWDRTHA